MNVRYMVELTDGERAQLQELTGGGDARVRRVKRAQILLAAHQVLESVLGANPGQDVGPNAIRIVVAQKLRTGGQAAQDGADAACDVVTRHLADLDVHIHAAEVAHCAAVQEVTQGDERGGLARSGAARSAFVARSPRSAFAAASAASRIPSAMASACRRSMPAASSARATVSGLKVVAVKG